MTIKKTFKLAIAASLLYANTFSYAQASSENSPFSWGVDFRLRFVSLNEIPMEAARSAGFKIEESNFTRFRTRLWGKYQFSEDYYFKARAVNEFRNYDQNNLYNDAVGRFESANAWSALDEIVFDEFYFDIKNQLDGKLNLRLGRQALIYGTGKVILEGNPLDGSRTIYNNAAKASYQIDDKHSIDLIYFNNPDRDDLAIHSKYRNIVEWDEEGAAIYAKNNHFKKLPFEYYYVYKEENRRGSDGDRVHLNTAGARIMPKFSPQFDGNFELAGQWGSQGDTDLEGMLFDSQINWHMMPDNPLKLTSSIGYYFLSGDESSSSKNEAWHPVLARWPQISELYLYSFIDGGGGHNIGGWSNVSIPWVGLSLVPFKNTKLNLRYYYMEADETNESTHPGLGDKRGDLFTAKLNYKINKNWFGHLVAEFLNPGNYYQDGMDDAYFLRAEINYKY